MGFLNPALLIVDHISPFVWIPILGHQFIIGFAVFSVIQGVFINETFHAAEADNEIMIRRAVRDTEIFEGKMKYFFKHANTNSDEDLSAREFKAAMANLEVNAWIASQGIDVDDIDSLWEELAGGSHKITLDELIVGVS